MGSCFWEAYVLLYYIQAKQREYIEDEDDYRNKTCYLPKKWIYTWEGHTQGVQAVVMGERKDLG